MKHGRIILLHGASSAGKSTLAKAVQGALDEPFMHFSSDHLSPGLPARRDAEGAFQWRGDRRSRFFDGFHHSIAALAAAGNDLIVEHIIECAGWRRGLQQILEPFDVFLVGVHCSLDEIDRRELARGDRRIGEGRSHLEDGIHTFGVYDCEVDTSGREPADAATEVVQQWRRRARSVLFAERPQTDVAADVRAVPPAADAIVIRPARLEELPGVLVLLHHLNPDDPSFDTPSVAETVWRTMLEQSGVHCVVAESAGELVGSCCLAIVPNLTRGGRPYALIENVVTHRDFRRRGIGRTVVRHALQVAWDVGCYKVMLLSGSRRPEVRGFYESCGFRGDEKTGYVAHPG